MKPNEGVVFERSKCPAEESEEDEKKGRKPDVFWNTVKFLVGSVIYCCLMAFYLPYYIIGLLVVKKAVIVLKLRRAFGIGYVKGGKLGLVSRRSRVTDVSVVSTDNEIDFLENRSPLYLYRMCFWLPRRLVKTALRQQKIELMSDHQLAYVILHTVFAHSVKWDQTRKMYRLYMEGFEDLFLFQGFYWDARNVLVSEDGEKIVIQMANGEEYHSDCDKRLRPTYELAKLHVQVCLSYFAPGLSHNHVHFVFPSAVTVLGSRLLNRKGILYKLLSPHFRFTERINYQALRVGRATNNKRSNIDRFFFFWQPFPVTKEQFLEGVARKCRTHYYEKCDKQVTKIREPNNESDEEVITPNKHSCIPQLLKENIDSPHVLFPPDFVRNKSLQKIPYLNFLAQYYYVVRQYVKSMEPYIDKEEWNLLAKEVAKHVPKFDQAPFIDAIATFIHQVGVIHFCDHNTYLRYFAYRYGNMAIRVPFEPFETHEDWEEFAQVYNFNLADVKKSPLLLLRQRDVLRTRCFFDIFVDFIPNPDCNLQLINTDYGFEEKGPKMAADNFLSQLRSLDGNLRLQDDIFPIPAHNTERRADGMRLVPLDDIVRTVCF